MSKETLKKELLRISYLFFNDIPIYGVCDEIDKSNITHLSGYGILKETILFDVRRHSERNIENFGWFGPTKIHIRGHLNDEKEYSVYRSWYVLLLREEFCSNPIKHKQIKNKQS